MEYFVGIFSIFILFSYGNFFFFYFNKYVSMPSLMSVFCLVYNLSKWHCLAVSSFLVSDTVMYILHSNVHSSSLLNSPFFFFLVGRNCSAL